MNHYVLIGQTPVIEPDLLTWAKWFEDGDHRRVALTPLPDGGRVSTVFLGLDHRFGGDGPPILFETMVFPSNECWRTCTWSEAEETHKQVVARLTMGAPE